MNVTDNEKLTAAYALNLWTVSIKQIIDYNDINIMQNEYDSIMNNLNLEKMPKDEALLDVIKEIMDCIHFFLMENGDKKFIEQEYQHKMKNAIWSAIPNVGAIFATANPVAMGITLATQVGIGYMNYRKNKAEMDLLYEKSRWEIQKNRMAQLHGLQKQLFDTAWRLAERYEFPDQYRLTEKQIEEYNVALIETNLIKKYNSLNSMRSVFYAYPAFWYQIGSTANNIYRDPKYAENRLLQSEYRKYALECFDKYEKLNNFNLLRHDVMTASWALEYIELLDLNHNNKPEEARKYIEIAEKYSGGQNDIIELCAFASLRIKDYDNAIKYFHILVNKNYNCAVNAQILSGLYIRKIINNDVSSEKAKLDYSLLKFILREEDHKFIIPLPPKGTNIDNWEQEWNKSKTHEEEMEEQAAKVAEESRKKEEVRKKAKLFYEKPITLVYKSSLADTAEYIKDVLEEYRDRVDSNLPCVNMCDYKDYERTRFTMNEKNSKIFLIGKTDIAKNIVQNSDRLIFEYNQYGIHCAVTNNKIVIIVNSPENSEIDGLIRLAKEINKRHPVKIPEGVASLEPSLMRYIFEGEINDVTSFISAVIFSVALSPILFVGEEYYRLKNGVQFVKNTLASGKIEFLQYSLGLYILLENEKAIIEA